MSRQSSLFLAQLAESFKKGGVKRSYNFPGFHSHELFEYMDGVQLSVNEKIAYELAWGSSQAGAKTLVTFKNVGLNDAADPFINSHVTGVGAGLVLVVFDDIELEGSQCILDSRHYFEFYGGLWLEPGSFKSAIVLAEAAPVLSEIFNIPVVVRLTNISVAFTDNTDINYSVQDICDIATKMVGVEDLYVEPIVHPINGNIQREMMRKKNRLIQSFVNELHEQVNTGTDYRTIAVGREIDHMAASILTLPVPDIDQKNLELVIEVGDPVVADQLLRRRNSEAFQSSTVGYNSKNSELYIRTARYERLFRLLKPDYQYITGDLGEYTKDTLNTLTHCLCFGSAVSVALGIICAGKPALAITGDASYYHSAKNAIPEALKRNVPIKIVLIDNGGSQGTGGQIVPGVIDKSIKVVECNFDAVSDDELFRIVQEFNKEKEAVLLKVNHEV